MMDGTTAIPSLFSPEETVPLDAPVREVTLLEDRAQVRRRGRAELPRGRVRLLVRGVAPVAVDKSLWAVAQNGGAGAEVTDLRVRRSYRSAEERKELDGGEIEGEVRVVEKELADLVARQNVSAKQQEMAEQIARQALADAAGDAAWGEQKAEGWRAALGEVLAQSDQLRAEAVALELREQELGEKLQDLRRRAEAARRPDRTMAADLEVELAVAAAGEHELEIGYVVPAACWRPRHQARLQNGAGGEARVLFQTDASVWQKTGEDWQDVNLSFSTQRTSRGHTPPLLSDDRLEARKKPEEVVVEAREVEVRTTGTGPVVHHAEDLPGIDDGGKALVLRGARPATVASDGRPCRVELSSFEAPASSEHVLMAERAAAVIHKVTLANTGDGPVLAGPVDLVAGGTPVGRTTVLYAAPGERFDLGFGPDPAIRVARLADQVEEEPGVLSRHVETRHSVTLKLSNIGPEPRSFTVRERVPVSEVEQVKVRLDEKETSPGYELDDDGFVSWRRTLAGGGHETLALRYSVVKRRDVKG